MISQGLFLINEGVSGSMTSYYERAQDSDLLAWEMFFCVENAWRGEVLADFPWAIFPQLGRHEEMWADVDLLKKS